MSSNERAIRVVKEGTYGGQSGTYVREGVGDAQLGHGGVHLRRESFEERDERATVEQGVFPVDEPLGEVYAREDGF